MSAGALADQQGPHPVGSLDVLLFDRLNLDEMHGGSTRSFHMASASLWSFLLVFTNGATYGGHLDSTVGDHQPRLPRFFADPSLERGPERRLAHRLLGCSFSATSCSKPIMPSH